MNGNEKAQVLKMYDDKENWCILYVHTLQRLQNHLNLGLQFILTKNKEYMFNYEASFEAFGNYMPAVLNKECSAFVGSLEKYELHI